MHNLTSRLYETVRFGDNNFIQDYNKNVFLKKKTSSIGFTDNITIDIKIKRSADPILKNYQILILKINGNKFKMLLNGQDLSKLNNPAYMKDSNTYLSLLTKLQQTTLQAKRAVIQLDKDMANFVESLENDKKNIIASQDACLKADTLAHKFSMKTFDLADEIQQCGLNDADISLIKAHSAGVYDIKDFTKKIAITLPKETTLIGLNHKNIILAMGETFNFCDYGDAYLRIFKCLNARDDFLEKLTDEDNPIIFLVPQKLFGSKQGVTASEMKWFLENPSKMKNVYFVFRSYKLYSKKALPSGLSSSELAYYTDVFTNRIFAQLKTDFILPITETQNYDEKIAKSDLMISQFNKDKPKPFHKPLNNVLSLMRTLSLTNSILPIEACRLTLFPTPTIKALPWISET